MRPSLAGCRPTITPLTVSGSSKMLKQRFFCVSSLIYEAHGATWSPGGNFDAHPEVLLFHSFTKCLFSLIAKQA